MAVYKVPQDVEADDKLLGPFSFRQFIYLIIMLMGVTLGWGLANIFLPLAIIPLPIVVFFGALALPLKKDQPMEVYLAAVLSFYMKPRKRIWKADGIQSLVEIIAPKVVEENRVKDLSQDEAEERLSYLANLVDSRGWAVRGVAMPQAENAMQADIFFEAQQTEDMLDDTSAVTHTFENMIDKADAKRRQEAMNIVNRPAAASQLPPTPDPYASLTPPLPQVQTQPAPASQAPIPQAAAPDPQVSYNPYPTAMRQSVIHPATSPPPIPPEPAAPPSHQPVSPGIINLANNPDLSIETIAHEAKRIRDKEAGTLGEEVVISLRG